MFHKIFLQLVAAFFVAVLAVLGVLIQQSTKLKNELQDRQTQIIVKQRQIEQLQNQHKQTQAAMLLLEQTRQEQAQIIINHKIQIRQLANENNDLKDWLNTAVPADIIQLYQRRNAANGDN